MKKSLAVTAAIATLTILLMIAPISYASTNKRIRPSDLQMILEDGFVDYADLKGIDLKSLSNEGANDLFKQFIHDRPQYADVVNAYTSMTHQYDSHAQDLNVSYDELINAEAIKVVKTWNEIIDGVQYSVTVTEVLAKDETVIYKVNYYSEDGTVQDPYIYVTHGYLYVWVLWWRITTGEFTTIQYRFMKNANGINEASRYVYSMKQKLNDQEFAFGLIMAGLLPFTFGLSALPGLFEMWLVQDACNELDAAYENTANYLQTIVRVSWNYAGVGSWFDVHTIWGDGSWHMIGTPAVDLGYTTSQLTQSFVQLGNAYGYNSWIWVGTYYG